jgi:hypothetical protein
MTNKEFSRSDPIFRKSCELAKCEATSRQASKYRRGKGRALKEKATAMRIIAATTV